MIKTFWVLTAFILWRAGQDVFVATWSTGTPDTDNYESLSFWIKDNKRAYIRYSHGKDAEGVDLNWLGTDSMRGARGFRISPPGAAAAPLVIVLNGDSLHVVGGNHYAKSFHWENENGDGGSSCSICAKSGSQAIGWLRRYFF